MKKVDSKELVNRGMLDEVVKTILDGMDNLFGNLKGEISNMRKEMNTRFDKLEAGQKDLQRQINDLKYDTPTQKEFDTLKSRVDKYHPLT